MRAAATLVAGALVALGCVGQPRSGAGGGAPPETQPGEQQQTGRAGQPQGAPTPPDLAMEVKRAELLGRELYEKDAVSARGTDVVLARFGPELPEPTPQGWVTRRVDTGWVVTFAREHAGEIQALYRVRMADAQSPGEVERVAPPEVVDAETAGMFRARLTAARASFMVCSERYNTAVLPARLVEGQGWLVYLLAATVDPDAMIAGGHHRMLVSPDGRRVMEQLAFTKSCLVLDKTVPSGGRLAAFSMTHLVSDTPTEVHVFLSLLHRMPLYVAVAHRRELWKVEGDAISFQGSLSP